MIINITVEPTDDPRFIKTVVAPELRAHMSFETTPEINVIYPSGRIIKF